MSSTSSSALRSSPTTETSPPWRLESLTAVILNWNTADIAIQSASLLIDDEVPPQRIVIVDNGSSGGDAAMIGTALPDCTVVQLAENRGVPYGLNAGARALPGDAYLIMDSDAFVHARGSIRRLLSALSRPGVGMVTPKLLNRDLTLQPTAGPFRSPLIALVQALGVGSLLPNALQPRWSRHWDHGVSGEISCCTNGAVLLIRGDVWTSLGGFNERIHMYTEDLDLSLRLRRLGWRIWFESEAEFVHYGNASAWSEGVRAEMIGRAEVALIREHLSPRRAALTLAVTRGGLLARELAFRALRRPERADIYRRARLAHR